MINISQMRNHHMDEINPIYAPLYLVKHRHYLMNERALISVPGGKRDWIWTYKIKGTIIKTKPWLFVIRKFNLHQRYLYKSSNKVGIWRVTQWNSCTCYYKQPLYLINIVEDSSWEVDRASWFNFTSRLE